MSDNEAHEKSRFWQLHLSTAMTLTIEASLLALLNLSNPALTRYIPVNDYLRGPEQYAGYGYGCHADCPFGWPAPIVIGDKPNIRIDVFCAVADGLICFGILCATALILESVIRRREGRKP
jgi:hypothetical protein